MSTSTLYALLPSLARLAGHGQFMRWLAHGDRLPDLVGARQALTRELFHFPGDAIPVAALRHHRHAEDARQGAWLAADPVYVRSEATGARLMNWPLTDLAADDAAQLTATLKPLFGDAGMPLTADTPTAWCIALADGASPAPFVRPHEALGVNLLECLPSGQAGRSWRKLFTEAQVLLHEHPVNQRRLDAGKLMANAVWFWGAGSLPAAADAAVAVVASTDDVLCGLARVAKLPWAVPAPSAIAGFPAAGSALLDLDTVGANDMGAWLAAFQAGLRGGRFAAVELVFADGTRLRLQHAHRLRFWRRT